jgi:hypothetical protein
MRPALYPRAGRAARLNPAGALRAALAASLFPSGPFWAVMDGPKDERSDPVAKTLETITLYGNLGGDPEPRQIPEKQGTRRTYDPVLDDVVEKPFLRKAREFRTFSLAISNKEMTEPRWIRCVDWANESRLFRKGDRVKLTGYFEVRTYEKDGQLKRVRQFVVKTAGLERPKIHQDEAA